jgi:hypothetical protein
VVSLTMRERYIWTLNVVSVPSNSVLCFIFAECSATADHWLFIRLPLIYSRIQVGMWRSV